jgi:putative peptidoglycan lipid II flippase
MSEEAVAIPAPPAKPVKSFVAHAKLIGGLTLVSRILGMARESVSAEFFGAGIVSSAFIVAFSIPNLFRKLFGEGALSAAFIPLYTKALKEDSGESVRGAKPTIPDVGSALRTNSPQSSEFAAASVNVLCIILLVITVVGELLLAAIGLLWHDMRPDWLLTLKFTAVMLPYVILICGTAFLSSILQVHRRFGLPAFAPVLLNVIHIVVIVVGAKFLHLQSAKYQKAFDPATIARQTTLAYWLSGFVLVAGVLQVMMLLPALRQVGFRLRWVRQFWTPHVKRMLMMTIPVALAASVLQVSVLMDKGISLLLARGMDKSGHVIDTIRFFGHTVRCPMEVGAAARLNWAQILYQFPLGVFAIALATAIFPGLSAEALGRDRTAFKSVLRGGIEATLFEGFAASIGLVIVRYPAAKLLFHLTPHHSDLIARSVLCYATAIWAFSMLQIVNRAYFALHDTKTPLVMSVLNILINLAVELPLAWVPGLGESAMAIGTSVSFAVQALVMLWLLDRRLGGLELSRIGPAVGKMLVAAIVMGAACLAVQRLSIYPNGETKWVWLIQLALLMGVGAVVYLGLCAMMGIGVMAHLLPKRMLRH